MLSKVNSSWVSHQICLLLMIPHVNIKTHQNSDLTILERKNVLKVIFSGLTRKINLKTKSISSIYNTPQIYL